MNLLQAPLTCVLKFNRPRHCKSTKKVTLITIVSLLYSNTYKYEAVQFRILGRWP